MFASRSLSFALALAAILVAVMPVEGWAGLRNTLIFAVMLLVTLDLWGRVRARQDFQLTLPLWPFWGLYAVVALIGLVWAVDIRYSWREIRHEILFSAVYFWVGCHLFRHRMSWGWLWRGLVVGNLVLVAYSLFSWGAGQPTKDDLFGTYHTGVGNFSTYLITVASFLMVRIYEAGQLSRWRGLALGLLLVANIAAMYVTANRQVFVALVVEIGVLVVMLPGLRRPRFLLVAALLVAASGVFFQMQMAKRVGGHGFQMSSINTSLEADGRLPALRFVWRQALEHPLTGAGMGREVFRKAFPDRPETQGPYAHAHNMMTNRLVQLGFPGALVFLALFVATALAMRPRPSDTDEWIRLLGAAGVAMCVGVFVKNMTDDFFQRELAYFFWLLSGAVIGFRLQSRQVGSG